MHTCLCNTPVLKIYFSILTFKILDTLMFCLLYNIAFNIAVFNIFKEVLHLYYFVDVLNICFYMSFFLLNQLSKMHCCLCSVAKFLASGSFVFYYTIDNNYNRVPFLVYFLWQFCTTFFTTLQKKIVFI